MVGSSGSLLRRRRGRIIDDYHDTVIRSNDAPAGGNFTPYVGARTSLRIWGAAERWRNWIGEREAGQQTLLRYCQPSQWMSTCWASIMNDPLPPRLSPSLWRELRTSQRATTGAVSVGTYPSTGAVAIWVAMQLCTSVRVFGFGTGSLDCVDPNEPTCARYHYAHALVPWFMQRRCGTNTGSSHLRMRDYANDRWHNVSMEWDWIKSLIRSGRVQQGPCE